MSRLGKVPELLLENMTVWQFEELRLDKLHFHTHNELAEHLVSLGIIGAFYLIFLYYIFKEAESIVLSKLGWLLFLNNMFLVFIYRYHISFCHST